MSETTGSGFDFEAWAALAREDPEQFERRRAEEIRKVIDARPDLRHRLEGLQFRIDAERKLARTPLKACLRISTLMWNSFYDLKRELEDASGGHGTPASQSASPPRDAEIIPLHRPAGPEDHNTR
jgi:hypothetical protein